MMQAITGARVLLLEPNAALRGAIGDVLTSERYVVEACDSLDQVLSKAAGDVVNSVGLIAWQSMEGLLADEHRHLLTSLTRRMRLVLMVPRRWKRLLETSDLGFAALVPRPFDAEELLFSLETALAVSQPSDQLVH
jgi:DNA-binding response OmpR family regulator